MNQTKLESLVESLVNIVIGYVVAILSQLLIFPMFGIHIPLSSNLLIGVWFTVISLIRSYAIRRWFNARLHLVAVNWARQLVRYLPMSTYQPSKWVIIKADDGEQTVYKVLAWFSGSYTWGESWKLSSGITQITQQDGWYKITNYSGSTYVCNCESEELSGYTAQVFETIKESNQSVQVTIIPITEILAQFA